MDYSVSVLTAIFQVDPTWVSRYQNLSILDFVGTKGNGGSGDNIGHAKLQSNRIFTRLTPSTTCWTRTILNNIHTVV